LVIIITWWWWWRFLYLACSLTILMVVLAWILKFSRVLNLNLKIANGGGGPHALFLPCPTLPNHPHGCLTSQLFCFFRFKFVIFKRWWWFSCFVFSSPSSLYISIGEIMLKRFNFGHSYTKSPLHQCDFAVMTEMLKHIHVEFNLI
jgi:hypothetical protein